VWAMAQHQICACLNRRMSNLHLVVQHVLIY
jgi:hypothetical protein